ERSLQKGFRNIHMELAATPDEAYRTLKKKNFDLILTDYYLPATNSDDHIRELSKIAPHIPLVVITGQGDEKAATRSIQ
ncbi:MAG TPA: hybrid sensor histidine kinase/response regulator, partial [Deltaproteobacteria bacterium]|nr:hybrid sensor histidine kinase/response regulator [Deltaproteobacteria bacterium]